MAVLCQALVKLTMPGWMDLDLGGATRMCDLKKLESGNNDVLGTGAFPAGHVTQIRLVVDSASLYFDDTSDGDACALVIVEPDGTSADLRIPSGEIKLNRGFDLTVEDATTVLIDFDAAKSIHETGSGQYIMRPVIAIVSVQ